MSEQLIAATALAKRWGMKTGTLSKWRRLKKGPRGWYALSPTYIVYPLEEVERFEAFDLLEGIDDVGGAEGVPAAGAFLQPPPFGERASLHAPALRQGGRSDELLAHEAPIPVWQGTRRCSDRSRGTLFSVDDVLSGAFRCFPGKPPEVPGTRETRFPDAASRVGGV